MPRYVIRVVYPQGVAWVRHGPVIGSGPIVRFPSKRAAEDHLALIRNGLDENCIASVVKIADPRYRGAQGLFEVPDVLLVAEPKE